MTYFAKPTRAAEECIRDRVGRVPGPLYVCAVKRRRRGNSVDCFVCGHRISHGEYYIANYGDPTIFLCELHIEGTRGAYSGPETEWPGAVEADKRRRNNGSAGSPSRTPDKPGDGSEHRLEAPTRAPVSVRIARMCKAQNWECAYPCAPNKRDGGKLLAGEPVAIIDDGTAVVHLDCVIAGYVPTEGNPHTTDLPGGKSGSTQAEA